MLAKMSLQNNKDNTAVAKKENANILQLLGCKCPRCRRGDMFEDKNPWHLKDTMKMIKHVRYVSSRWILNRVFILVPPM
jgi:hypothetical protein